MVFGTISHRHTLNNSYSKTTYATDLKDGEKIHHSLAVYANGERIEQGIVSTDLKDHISYNQVYRAGRSLFIDGVCMNQGYLSNKEIEMITKELQTNPVIMTHSVTPYR